MIIVYEDNIWNKFCHILLAFSDIFSFFDFSKSKCGGWCNTSNKENESLIHRIILSTNTFYVMSFLWIWHGVIVYDHIAVNADNKKWYNLRPQFLSLAAFHLTFMNFKMQRLGKIKIKIELQPKMYKIIVTLEVLFV